MTSRLPSGWRSGTSGETTETTARTGDSGRCSAIAGLRADLRSDTAIRPELQSCLAWTRHQASGEALVSTISRSRTVTSAAALPNLAVLDQGGACGACGAAGPASAPGSAVERPARRTPGRTRRVAQINPAHASPTDAARPGDSPDRAARPGGPNTVRFRKLRP